MSSATRDEEAVAVQQFLHLLHRDIEAHPERLQRMPETLYRRFLAVTEGVHVDTDDPIEGPVAL